MSRAALFAYGFRPFFLAAGLAAVVLVPAWVATILFGTGGPTTWPAGLWHGHEMVFGFVGAALAGFLLTAVPSWTGQRGYAGTPLALLAALWLLGRTAVAAAAHLPALLVAAADVAFLPALAVLIAPSLARTRNRNALLLLVLLALTAGNAVFHRAVIAGDGARAHAALLAVVNVVLLLVTLIGGRIVPAFTRSGLRETTTPATPLGAALGSFAIAAMGAVLLVDLAFPGGPLAVGCAFAAALIQALRLAHWRGWRAYQLPIVWILHVAYAWLPAGLALKALALLTGAGFAAYWMHALTAGAAATMILAVMTRAALGHTGRPLLASPPTVCAYVLLTLAAGVRVLGPSLVPAAYTAVIATAGILWTAAFALFLAVYAPILAAPRVDGRPG